MKYTPGPWEWWTSCSFKRLTHKTDGDVLSAFVASDGHPCVNVSEEDANLIAAAPDLLEALKFAIRGLDINHVGKIDGMSVDEMKAAIAKAEGNNGKNR